jgi:hypothetical protein
MEISGLRYDDATSREGRMRVEKKKIDASSQGAPECYSCHWRPQSREAVQGKDIEMMNENISGLWHFATPSFGDSADAEARSRISALEEGVASRSLFCSLPCTRSQSQWFLLCPVAGGQD